MGRVKNGNEGMGLASVLLVLFVVLKLTGNIGWSWLWVLSPLWIGASLWVLMIVAAVAVSRWLD